MQDTVNLALTSQLQTALGKLKGAVETMETIVATDAGGSPLCHPTFQQLIQQVKQHTAESMWVNQQLQQAILNQQIEQRVAFQLEHEHNQQERQHAEGALRLSEEQLRLALDLNHIGSWDWQLSTNEVTWNPNHFRLLGYVPEDTGATYQAWRVLVHPEDIDRVEQAVAQSLETHADFAAEYRVIHPDGSLHWLVGKGRGLYDANGRATRMIGVIMDVTDRKQAEADLQQLNQELEVRVQERTAQLEHLNHQLQVEILERKQIEEDLRHSEEQLHKVFEDAPIAISLADPFTYRIVRVNAVHHEMLGYSDAELATMSFAEFTHPDDLQANVDNIQKLLEGTVPRFQMEKRFIRKNGEMMWANLTVTLIRDAHNCPLYSMGMIEDITDRKRGEAKRKQVEAQLRMSLNEKEVLLKEIHHRVKNNLQTIYSLLSLQANSIQDVRILAPFRESQNRIKAMVLIHEKLYQSDGLARINVAEYIRKLTTDLVRSYTTNPSAIALRFEVIDAELAIDTVIPCGLIINELISNAAKYAFPDGRSGEIHILFDQDETGQCILSISDNGVGIHEAIDLQTTASLGLQLICAFTQQLRGTIELSRTNGSSFKIVFNNSVYKGYF